MVSESRSGAGVVVGGTNAVHTPHLRVGSRISKSCSDPLPEASNGSTPQALAGEILCGWRRRADSCHGPPAKQPGGLRLRLHLLQPWGRHGPSNRCRCKHGCACACRACAWACVSLCLEESQTTMSADCRGAQRQPRGPSPPALSVSPVVGPDSPASHGPPGVQLMSTCDPVPSDSACNGLFSPQLRLSSVLQPKSYGPRTLRRRRTSEGAQCTPQQRAPIPAAHSGSEPVRSPIPHCPVHPPTASNAGRRFVLPSLVMDGRSWTHGEAEAAAPGRGLPPRCRASVSGPGQHSAPRPTEYWRSCLPSLARQCLQL